MTNVTDADLNGLAISFLNATGGVVGTSDYLVSAQTSPNMTVQIAGGRAWLPNTTTPLTNMFGTYLDAPVNLTIANNTSGQPRTDYLILYLNLSASPSATGGNIPQFADAQGSPGANPSPPTPTQIISGTSGTTWGGIGAGNPYLILAQIGQSPTWIPSGVGSINSTMIASLRTFAFFATGQTIPVLQYEEFTDQAVAPSNPVAGKTRFFTINGNLFMRQPTGSSIQIGSSSLVNNGNSGATPSVDWTQGITQAFTLNTTNIVFTFTNPTGGGKYILFLTQDSTGGRTISPSGWPNVRWSNNVPPTLSTAPNKVDVVGLIWNNVINQYLGFYQTTF